MQYGLFRNQILKQAKSVWSAYWVSRPYWLCYFYSAMSMQGLKLIFMFERFTFRLFDNTLNIIAIVSTVSINVMNFNYSYGNFR